MQEAVGQLGGALRLSQNKGGGVMHLNKSDEETLMILCELAKKNNTNVVTKKLLNNDTYKKVLAARPKLLELGYIKEIGIGEDVITDEGFKYRPL